MTIQDLNTKIEKIQTLPLEQSHEQIEILLIENSRLENLCTIYETDLRTIKNILLEMVTIVGMVNADGTINEKIKLKRIMSEITSIAFSAMSPFADKTDLENRFGFIKDILPIYEKYKNL